MAFPYGFAANDLHKRLSPSRIAEITDGDASKVEEAAIDTAAEIELHAGKFYSVPLAPFTDGVRTLFLDLWRWRLLFNCRPEWLNTDDKESEEYAIAQQRRRIEKWLCEFSPGDLPGVTAISDGASQSGGAWSIGSVPVMTRRALLKL